MIQKIGKILSLFFLFNLFLAMPVLANENEDITTYEQMIQEKMVKQEELKTKTESPSFQLVQDDLLKKMNKPENSVSTTNDTIYENEPNSTLTTADQIYLNSYVTGTDSPYYDLDYYKLTVNQAGTLNIIGVGVGSSAAYGDYLLIGLRDSSDGTLGWSQTKTSSASGSKYQLLSQYVSVGTYYLCVMGKPYSTGSSYHPFLNETYMFQAYMNDVSGTVSVTGVSLNKATTSLAVGANETLTATLAPSTATNKNVTWKSSNTAVATVDSNGKVVGLKAGTAIVTVTTVDGSKTATCTVTVSGTVSVTGVSLALSLKVGGATATLVAIETPTKTTKQVVTWTSSNTAVATVVNGIVTPKSAGTATITVTTQDGSKTASYTVIVTR